MIRLVLVIPTLDRSGAEKQLTLLATHLPRDEFEVHVVALTRGGPYAELLQQAGIPLHVLNKRSKFDPVAMWRLRRLLTTLQPDVVHSWLFAANAAVRMVVPTGPRRPAVVVSERCVDSWKAGWQLWVDRRQIAGTDRLVANSRPVRDFYRGVGYSDQQLVVIPNAVEVPPQPPFSREQLCHDLELPADARLVGYAGRFARQKRVQDLVWACQLLRQADPRMRLLLCGDGPEREALLHYSKQVECRDFVKFLGNRSDAASLMHRVDVFWLASDFEGMSNSLMEAMACRKPVVVSDIPPNRELVRHDRDGFLVDVGDSVAFAQFTRRLFEDPTLAKRLGDSAGERMEHEFGLASMVQGHADLYREVTAGSP